MRSFPIARPVAWSVLAAVLCLAGAPIVQAGDEAPVNAACPVDDAAVQGGITTTHDGRVVGFCSEACRAKFLEDPAKWAAALSGPKRAPGGDPAGQGAAENKENGPKPAADPPPAKKPAGDNSSGGAAPVDARKAPAFNLQNMAGKPVTLEDFKGKIVVLQWINPGCPYCRRVMEKGRVADMLKELKAVSKDVVFLPVASEPKATVAGISEYLKSHELDTPALMDPDGTMGKAYGAKTTPHVFVIDGEGRIRYSGAFDDDPKGKKKKSKITNAAVRAVRQLVAGEQVQPSQTDPYG